MGPKPPRSWINFPTLVNLTLLKMRARATAMFSAYRLDDEGTIAEIAGTAQQTGMVIDPHSAVGLSAARRALADGTVPGVPIVSFACAHPAKFDQAVKTATGATPVLPPHG